ncbi:flavin monoamine oxidase family protein [uncultured Sphingomonas sp.]|uniref:flavin monoamine oxidase family protein n=1 Tax=uncultured Sphingomonas sp. TaxID=158754 RepID=UPI0035CC449C
MRGSTGLWHALETAREINLAEAGEACPVAGRDGETRRGVLKALAAASVIAALPRPARAAPIRGPVAIIGGGIAGLSALWQLAQAGIDAHLYEARPRTGGRMFTLHDGATAVEIGGQLVNTDHADMHALTKAFDVALIDRKAGDHRTAVLGGGAEIPEARLVEGLRGIAGQIGRDADRLDQDYAGVAPLLDRLSFTGYLDRHAGLMPDPWVRRLMEATARTEYGVEPGEASAIELIFNMPTVDGTRIDVLSNSDERFLMAGGSSSLIAAMTARLQPHISTAKVCTRIDPRGGGVRIGFADGSHVDAGAVIVTTPAAVTRRIAFGGPLPALWRRFIAEVTLGKVGKINAEMTARPWEATFGRGGELWQTDAARGTALGWDSGIRPSTGAGSVWTWFLGGDEVARADAADAHALALKFARDAEAAAPGMAAATGARTWRTAWHRERHTGGGYVNFSPGQLTRFAPLIWTQNKDGMLAEQPVSAAPIWFAGEHLSDAYPGYMNGGAQTGRWAAEAVIAASSLKRAA